MPGRTISPNEAVTMVLRAIGYTDNASVLVGQWPANYVALGQNQNLYAKVANDLQMNKASAAQMIYNALTVQLVQVDANSMVSYLWDRIGSAGSGDQAERTLLTTGLNCYAEGKKIVTYADAAASKINLIPKVGAYGVLYRSNADREVVALTKVETEFIAGRFMFTANTRSVDKFQGVDGVSYNLDAGAKAWVNALHSGISGDPDYALATSPTITTNTAIFLNGDQLSGNTAWTNKFADDYIYFDELIDTDNDTIPDTRWKENQSAKLIISAKVSGVTILELRALSIWDANYGGSEAFLYASGQISSDGKKFNGHDFPLDVNNDVDEYGYVLAGVDSLDDLATDNVVYVYRNADKKIARIDVGTDTQTGPVTNVNVADYARTIGGKVLYTAPYAGKTRDDVDTAGNEGTALLDIYGRIFDFQLSDAFKGNFAVYITYGTPFINATQAKIFDKTSKEVVYEVGGATGFDAYVKSLPGNTLIEYKISGGKLDKIPQIGSIGYAADKDKINKAGSIITINGASKLLDSGALVYVEDSKGDISLASVKDLLDKELTQNYQYIEADGKVKALLVSDKDTGAQSVYVMINSISRGYANGDIDVVKGLGFAEGSTTWDYVDSSLRDALYPGAFAAPPLPGIDDYRGSYAMMVKFSIGEDGVLKGAKRLDDSSLYTTTVGGNPTIVNASVGANSITGNSDGTFSIKFTTPGAVDNLVAFEANAVLYKKVGVNWVAYSVTDYNFKDADGYYTGTYTFLKTNAKNAYDVIIKN
jgi:hypothetical protein